MMVKKLEASIDWRRFCLILAIISLLLIPLSILYQDSIYNFLARDTINLEDGSISFSKSCIKNADYFNNTTVENINNRILKIRLGDKASQVIYGEGMIHLYYYKEADQNEHLVHNCVEHGSSRTVFDILDKKQDRDDVSDEAIICGIEICSAGLITLEGITVGDTLQKVSSVYPLEMKDSIHSGNINIESFQHKKLNVDFLFVNSKLVSIKMYKSSFDI